MKKLRSIMLIALIVFAAMTLVGLSVVKASTVQPTIATDKADYAASDTVIITGTGFLPNAPVTLTLTGPPGFETYSWVWKSEANGDLLTSYQGLLMEGTFTLQATDGTNPTATTTFTDKVPKPVSVTAEPGGTVKYSPKGTGIGVVYPGPAAQFTVLSGTHITFTAIPSSGFKFTYWSGDVSGSTNPYTVEVGSGKSVTAHFSLVMPLPEYPFGAFAALGASLAAFLVYKRKNLRFQ